MEIILLVLIPNIHYKFHYCLVNDRDCNLKSFILLALCLLNFDFGNYSKMAENCVKKCEWCGTVSSVTMRRFEDPNGRRRNGLVCEACKRKWRRNKGNLSPTMQKKLMNLPLGFFSFFNLRFVNLFFNSPIYNLHITSNLQN